MPLVKQLNGLELARGNKVDGWDDGDYMRVIALGSCPIMTSPAVIWLSRNQ
jgi:hypothetical protein